MNEKDLPAVAALPDARVTVKGNIRPLRGDHVARYRWAAEKLHGSVIDAGCNCGYGAAMLADAGLNVLAIDIWPGGIAYAMDHWNRPSIVWTTGDICDAGTLPECDGIAAFEVVEHLEHPDAFLRSARDAAPVLLASVPNENVWPWQPRLAPAHKRHYTGRQFDELLHRCGWAPVAWYGQGPHSPPIAGYHGRTHVVECQ